MKVVLRKESIRETENQSNVTRKFSYNCETVSFSLDRLQMFRNLLCTKFIFPILSKLLLTSEIKGRLGFPKLLDRMVYQPQNSNTLYPYYVSLFYILLMNSLKTFKMKRPSKTTSE